MGNNGTTVRRLYEAFGAGDVPSVLEAMDPQIRWEEPEGMPVLTTQVGPEAVLQNIFAPLQTLFRDFSVNVEEVHDAGDVVLALGVYAGMGAETGRTLHAHFAHVWRCGTDGKVKGFRTYTDTHLWREVLGANMPASSAP